MHHTSDSAPNSLSSALTLFLLLLLCFCMKLIAYELAILKGINPDVPRNLAKAVTVD